MPFSDQTEYPRGIFHTGVLTNSAQSVGTGRVKVSHVLINGGAADEIVNFRGTGGTPATYFTVSVPAGELVVIPRGFEVSQGLEALTISAAGDVWLTVFYFDA